MTARKNINREPNTPKLSRVGTNSGEAMKDSSIHDNYVSVVVYTILGYPNVSIHKTYEGAEKSVKRIQKNVKKEFGDIWIITKKVEE